MTFYSLNSRNGNSYTLPNQNTGNLLAENGDILTTEDGKSLLLENPTNNPNLTARNGNSYTLPTRN